MSLIQFDVDEETESIATKFASASAALREANDRAAKYHNLTKMLTEALNIFQCSMNSDTNLWADELLTLDTAQAMLGEEGIYEIDGHSVYAWAGAIADRITDEYSIEMEDDDKDEFWKALFKAFMNTPSSVKALVGSMVIETDYFEGINDLAA